MDEITAGAVWRSLPRRDPAGHKGMFGKVMCLCGCVGFTGAPVFASRAAVRTGSGLVYLGVPAAIWQVAAVKSDEAMPFPLPDRDGKLACAGEEEIRRRAAGCDAVLIGCGLGRSDESDRLVRSLLDLPRPLVLDADGINAVSGTMGLLSVRRGRVTVLTPHDAGARGSGTPLRAAARGVSDPQGPPDGHRRAGRALRRESDGKRRDGQGRQRRRALRDGAEPARTGDGAVCGVLRGGVSARAGRGSRGAGARRARYDALGSARADPAGISEFIREKMG